MQCLYTVPQFSCFHTLFGSIRSGLDALTNDCIALLIKLTGKIHLDVQSEPADTLPFLILLCSIISAASAKLFSAGRRIAAYAVILFGTVLSASGIAQSPVGAVLIIASGITHLAAGSLSVPHFQKRAQSSLVPSFRCFLLRQSFWVLCPCAVFVRTAG